MKLRRAQRTTKPDYENSDQWAPMTVRVNLEWIKGYVRKGGNWVYFQYRWKWFKVHVDGADNVVIK